MSFPGDRRASKKPIMAIATIAIGLVSLIITMVKFSDAFDYFVGRSQPLIDIRANFREEKIQQEGINKNLSEKVDEVRTDTKAILRELRRR